MAEIRQNAEVFGKLTVEGGGASTPLEVKGSSDSGVTSYTQFKLTDQNTGNLLELFNQAGTSEFTVSTLGTTIGGSYVLPHVAPDIGQVLTRATGAGAGVVSWEDNVADAGTIGGEGVDINALTANNILQYNGTNWVNVAPVVPATPNLSQVVTAGSSTDDAITVGGITVDEVTYDGADGTEGQVLTTDGNGTLTFEDASIDLVAVDVHNDSGSTIARGFPVYISGTHASGKPTIALADNNANGTMPCIGLVQASISNNSDGTVIVSGMQRNLDTSSFSAGDALYIDSTAGVLTATRPSAATSQVQKVGIVTRSHVSVGEILVMGAGRVNDIPNDVEFNDLSGVDTTGIADGDGIRYNGTSYVAGKWGVGAEDQTIEPNQTTTTTTSRAVKLDTAVAAGQIFSVTTLDLTDGDDNRLERCQVTTVDVGAGPSTSVLQEKYGSFYIKRDASETVDPKLFFNYQYASGGNTAAFGINAAPSNTYCLNLPSTTTGVSAGDVISVKSGSTAAEVELELSTPTLDSVTDGGATTTNSITTGTQVVNGSNALVPGVQFNYTGAAADNVPGLALSADNANIEESLPLISWSGPDSASNTTVYGGITCVPTDKTNGSEDSYFAMGSMKAGTFVKGFKVAGDVVSIGNAFTSTDYELPSDRGTDGYVLTTDGVGGTSWAAGGGSSSTIQYCSTMGTFDTSGSNADDYIPFAYHIESTSASAVVNSVMMCPYDTVLKRISFRFEANPGAMVMKVYKLASGAGAVTLLDTISFTPSTTAGAISNADFTSASTVNAGEGILIKLDYTNTPQEVHWTLAYTIDTSS